MIYFDSSATSLQKPKEVADAMHRAVLELGNPGRSAYGTSLAAGRTVLDARKAVAALAGSNDPSCVAFTSGVTESLNLVINGLVCEKDAVITTVLEHNSVLRPLYQSGCALSFLDCDDAGNLLLDELPKLIKKNTTCVVCTGGSNVLGSLTDVKTLHQICRQHGLVLVLDAAQTFGSVPLALDDADFICFTGHKSLLGPQGTGGTLSTGAVLPHTVKTGGTGYDSFSARQPLQMPDMFEAGTPNVPGICGLHEGVRFLLATGIDAVQKKELALLERFLQGIQEIPGLTVYGNCAAQSRLPVVSVNIGTLDAEDVSLRLWEEYDIATRPGSHCAPLVHQRFGTKHRGMVRFSFGYFNTGAEIDTAINALKTIAKQAG